MAFDRVNELARQSRGTAVVVGHDPRVMGRSHRLALAPSWLLESMEVTRRDSHLTGGIALSGKQQMVGGEKTVMNNLKRPTVGLVAVIAAVLVLAAG